MLGEGWLLAENRTVSALHFCRKRLDAVTVWPIVEIRGNQSCVVALRRDLKQLAGLTTALLNSVGRRAQTCREHLEAHLTLPVLEQFPNVTFLHQRLRHCGECLLLIDIVIDPGELLRDGLDLAELALVIDQGNLPIVVVLVGALVCIASFSENLTVPIGLLQADHIPE